MILFLVVSIENHREKVLKIFKNRQEADQHLKKLLDESSLPTDDSQASKTIKIRVTHSRNGFSPIS
jgi:hypothetical protein